MRIGFVLLMLLSSYSASFAADNPEIIQVVTYNGKPVENEAFAKNMGIKVEVYNLDDQFNLQDELSKGLPYDDIKKAKEIAERRVYEVDPSRWDNLWRGALLAKKYGFTNAPAVIFNKGKYIIYGVTDLKSALELYKRYQDKQGG